MKKQLFGLALAAVLVGLGAGESHALRHGFIVTKATQKEHGLTYNLQAEKSGDVVLVTMEIPRAGKLKELESVALEMSGERRVPLHAPLAMSQKNGVASVRFQVGTEFVQNCSIMLFLRMHGRTGQFYGVQLKDYVTERKAH
ncbi:MAG: hypothetical protein ACO1SX_20260 [Actinomycetota bacterium]